MTNRTREKPPTPRVGIVPKQSRPRMVLKNFRLPETLWLAVEDLAAREEANPSDVLRAAVQEYVERHGGKVER